ncbi:hypothetical protein, partial [Microbacterium sp.]|uniref:hypothetical protein n=1 Tax=Microbacterium sp. TaxID=51671 RepID=UPI00281197C6
LPRPDGEVWFTGLSPTRLDHGAAAAAVAYGRRIDGADWELAADDARVEVRRDGERAFAFPRGWRVIADRTGSVRAVVGIGARPVAGALDLPTGSIALEIAPNERVELDGTTVGARAGVEFVPPVF